MVLRPSFSVEIQVDDGCRVAVDRRHHWVDVTAIGDTFVHLYCGLCGFERPERVKTMERATDVYQADVKDFSRLITLSRDEASLIVEALREKLPMSPAHVRERIYRTVSRIETEVYRGDVR